MGDETTTRCVVCGGELKQRYRFPPFTPHTVIGRAQHGERDGYYCEACGIRYNQLPKADACVQVKGGQ